jgi:Asp-tRNA(Asn)/Glu-tRNA(Gln) amidotransferase A subunit family amidase
MLSETADPLVALDATAQAEFVRRGDVTPLELVEAAIARIERQYPALDVVVTPLVEQARVQFVADYGRDDVLIRVAAQLEVARHWVDRWPPAINASASPLPTAAVA